MCLQSKLWRESGTACALSDGFNSPSVYCPLNPLLRPPPSTRRLRTPHVVRHYSFQRILFYPHVCVDIHVHVCLYYVLPLTWITRVPTNGYSFGRVAHGQTRGNTTCQPERRIAAAREETLFPVLKPCI